jgi:Tol biopolymer transport system component
MAVACLERARKLDPGRTIYAVDLAMCHNNARQFSRAIECCLGAIQSLGAEPRLFSSLALTYRLDGQLEQAVQAGWRAAELDSEHILSSIPLAVAEAATGDASRARILIQRTADTQETGYVSGYLLALLHLACGERDLALDCLERAWRDRDWWVLWLGVGPAWDELRGNPRFVKLLLQAPAELRAQAVSPPAPEPLTPRKRMRWRIAIAAAVLLASVSGVLLYRGLQPESVPFQEAGITRLTANGAALCAAISPDGRFVAYAAPQDGEPVVWVRELNGSSAYRVAGPVDGEIRSLEFIRDGRYVSFLAYPMNEPAKGVLYAAPISPGTVETMMSGVPGPAAVSADGSGIAFYRSNRRENADELVVRKAGGSGEHRIAAKHYPDRFWWNTPPAWSPDGRRLACAVEGSDPAGFRVAIAVVDLKGSIRMVKSPRWQRVGGIAWMKNPSGFLVIGQEHDASFEQIWFVPERHGEARRLTKDLNDYKALSLVADGSAMVSVQVQTRNNVYLLRPDDPGHGAQITPGSGRYFDLAWGPDGRIFYASDASGSADIWSMNADGSSQQQLTRGAGRNFAPAVSADGRTVVFHSNRDGSWNIWAMNPAAPEPVRLTRGAEDSNWPQFSADSSQVVYHRTGLNALFNLWKVPVGGGTATQMTSQLTMHPAISRLDGRIACWYSADAANPRWKLAVFSADATQLLRQFEVPGTVAPDSPLRWTPESDGIAYIDDRYGVSNIWVQPVDGKAAHALTAFTFGTVYSFDWARDGRLVYSRGIAASDAVLIRDKSKGTPPDWVR